MDKRPICEGCYFHMCVTIPASLDGPAEEKEWCEVTGKSILSYPAECSDYARWTPEPEAGDSLLFDQVWGG